MKTHFGGIYNSLKASVFTEMIVKHYSDLCANKRLLLQRKDSGNVVKRCAMMLMNISVLLSALFINNNPKGELFQHIRDLYILVDIFYSIAYSAFQFNGQRILPTSSSSKHHNIGQ